METLVNKTPEIINEKNPRRKNKMKRFSKVLKNQKGLTLIELLAVIVILAIVAAIAVPAIGGVIENSKYNAVKADALNAINAASLYFSDDKSTSTSVTVTTLVDQGYLESKGKLVGTETISKATPRSITSATAVTYSGTKTITFTGATVSGINADNTKGSATPAAGSTGFTISQ